MNWVVADWNVDGEVLRFPAYNGGNGQWWRAGVSDYGGPTMLRMDVEPLNVFPLGAIADHPGAKGHSDVQGALVRMEVRQAPLADRVERLYQEVIYGLRRIESAACGGALADHRHTVNPMSYSSPFAPMVYMSEGPGAVHGGIPKK